MAMTIRKANHKDITPLRSLISDLAHHPISSEDIINRLQVVAESNIDSLLGQCQGECIKTGEVA
jgi:N-acetylglutamate synthase-like GNAT family acetyltransferase